MNNKLWFVAAALFAILAVFDLATGSIGVGLMWLAIGLAMGSFGLARDRSRS